MEMRGAIWECFSVCLEPPLIFQTSWNSREQRVHQGLMRITTEVSHTPAAKANNRLSVCVCLVCLRTRSLMSCPNVVRIHIVNKFISVFLFFRLLFLQMWAAFCGWYFGDVRAGGSVRKCMTGSICQINIPFAFSDWKRKLCLRGPITSSSTLMCID